MRIKELEKRFMQKLARKPLLVLVASGRREYREDAVAAIAHRFRIHLFDASEPTWQRPYIESFDIVTDFSAARLVELIERLREPVAGVICWDEARILDATVLADALGLPSAGAEAVRVCRDKYTTRIAMGSAGILQPKWALAADAPSALQAAEAIGYPVVLKPRSAAASLGVVKVAGPGALETLFTFVGRATITGAPEHEHPVLIEEFLDGPEISIDSLVMDGVATPLVIARKSIGYAPYFEETGHEVAVDDPLLTDTALTDAVAAIHKALGFGWGWTHTEMKLTERGPSLVEVNARIGGGLIARLAALTHGIDAADLLADAVTGVASMPTRVPTAANVAASRFLYSSSDNATVLSARFDLMELPQEVDRAVVLTEPGAVLRTPPEGLFSGRAAVIVASGDSKASVRRALDAAADAFELVVSD